MWLRYGTPASSHNHTTESVRPEIEKCTQFYMKKHFYLYNLPVLTQNEIIQV